MASKRLLKELDANARDPSPAFSDLAPVSESNLFDLRATLHGPAGTPYEGGSWLLALTIPPTYPNSPPSIRFVTPICHSNVHFQTGEICLDLLKTAWTPAYGLAKTLEAVAQLLSAGGEPDSPLNIDLAGLIRSGDVLGAQALVRFYTTLFAMG